MKWTLVSLLVGCLGGCAAVKAAQDDDRAGAPAPLAKSDGSTPVEVSPGEMMPEGDPGVPRLPDDVRATITDRPWTATAKVKVCINKEGGIYKAEVVKSTGRVDVDDAIVGVVRGWKYRSHFAGKKLVQACTSYLWTFKVE